MTEGVMKADITLDEVEMAREVELTVECQYPNQQGVQVMEQSRMGDSAGHGGKPSFWSGVRRRMCEFAGESSKVWDTGGGAADHYGGGVMCHRCHRAQGWHRQVMGRR